jgi:energy-coupling factor transport system ATP-binding protein
VEEEVRFAPRNLGRVDETELERLWARAGLEGLRHRASQALSVGEQQRTALAATLSMQPRLLILDEPTLGQDRRHLRELMGLMRTLNEQGQTVLLITHDRDLVAHCAGRVWELVDGRLHERRRSSSHADGGDGLAAGITDR